MQVDLESSMEPTKAEKELLKKMGFLQEEPVPYDEEKMKAALEIPAVKHVRVFKHKTEKNRAKRKRKAQRKSRKNK